MESESVKNLLSQIFLFRIYDWHYMNLQQINFQGGNKVFNNAYAYQPCYKIIKW